MVSKPNHAKINYKDAPPPKDESWWQAVLAEDEATQVPQAVQGEQKEDQHFDSANQQEPNQTSAEESADLDWEMALTTYEQDQVVALQVTGFNRGGLLVSGKGLQGFVPLSHLVDMLCEEDDPSSRLEEYIDQTLRLKVIECDQERGRIVFSERAALAEPGSRKQLLDSLKPGNCTTGSVTNITDFGVFVDLGGVEGLVHVSEISWGRVHHPSDVVALGEEVKVYVIQVDYERARVALSLKRLYPNPWKTAQARYYPGQITEAVVTSIVPFGAFARLEEGLDGLIHISEMKPDSAGQPGLKTYLKEGQTIQVRVLHVDADRQRLGLSLYLGNTSE